MIQITVCKNQANEYTAFQCMGHAEYDVSGKDIICSAVSALVINTINSVEQFTTDKFTLDTDHEEGLIRFTLEEDYSQSSLLLLRSLVLGLQGIQQNYGTEYIMLKFKEV
ncbi:MAG: ribosomal-processing cysteine protease Prp [Lachnospiraceae bacterium]|jgi:uncharacterized protein YsxB (DUF464 family)|nr:ribosomal-processing cysteine protease Prp [Lachnospiraceae bacterium]